MTAGPTLPADLTAENLKAEVAATIQLYVHELTEARQLLQRLEIGSVELSRLRRLEPLMDRLERHRHTIELLDRNADLAKLVDLMERAGVI